MASQERKFEEIPFEASFGAWIVGIDLSEELSDEVISKIKNGINRHQVVVFPKQKLSGSDLVRFTSYLGKIATSALDQYLHKEHSEISVISNILDETGKNIGLPDAGSYWHTDASYFPNPHMYTLLYALEVPKNQNGTPLGDTQFASTADAFDALPPAQKNQLLKLKAIHSITKRYQSSRMAVSKREDLTEKQKERYPSQIHPVIRTHPLTNRKCIYVNDSYTQGIVGMSDDEGLALINKLREHYTKSDFYYRHKWSVGDLVVWDNCSTQHVSTFDYALPQRRLLYRTTIQGTAVF